MHVGTILALPRWGRPTGEGSWDDSGTYVVLVHVWACRRGDGFVECSVPELLPFFPFFAAPFFFMPQAILLGRGPRVRC